MQLRLGQTSDLSRLIVLKRSIDLPGAAARARDDAIHGQVSEVRRSFCMSHCQSTPRPTALTDAAFCSSVRLKRRPAVLACRRCSPEPECAASKSPNMLRGNDTEPR